ncbi:MAG TPA: magnesium/cobalt transporter CorA [Aggregatilineales bacterium]|nr:magnesium/cobalt transporter CorA [Aggregatilineales bacterium]
MQHLTLFHSSDHQSTEVTDLPGLLASEDQLFWLDLRGPDEEAMRLMRDVFHFHPVAIEDTRNHEQRPKLEEYNGHIFLIVNPVSMHGDHALDFRELDIFVGRNFVVTVHPDEEPVIKQVQERLAHTNRSQMSVSYLLYLLLDATVDGYFPVMDAYEEAINRLEDEAFINPRQQTLNDIFALKRELLNLWRVVWPSRDLVSNLAQPHVRGFEDGNPAEYYMRDVSDHLFWIADMITTFRETLMGMIDLYMSAVSNRLNRVVNRLTVLTLGFGVLAVITGFFGMNFTRTWPDFENPMGVLFVIGLMVLVGIVMAYVLWQVDRYYKT